MAAGTAKRWRRLRMMTQTALGFGARGFFTPYRYAAETVAPNGYPEVAERFAAEEPQFRAVLERISGFSDDLRALGSETPPAPRWDQGWFAPLDAAVAYALTRSEPPRRIVEVGSGHSTRFLARALADAGADCQHVCVDPAPRAALDGLPIDWRRALLSKDQLPLFDTLEAGDIAFFDSSHILWPGLDVDLILNRILPRLRPGVRVHIHDIFLPDPYPDDWAWRGYTEQLGLGGWIMGGAYRTLFASAYAVTRMDALDTAPLPDLPRHAAAIDSSLWLERAA